MLIGFHRFFQAVQPDKRVSPAEMDSKNLGRGFQCRVKGRQRSGEIAGRMQGHALPVLLFGGARHACTASPCSRYRTIASLAQRDQTRDKSMNKCSWFAVTALALLSSP